MRVVLELDYRLCDNQAIGVECGGVTTLLDRHGDGAESLGVELNPCSTSVLRYSYALIEEGEVVGREWRKGHSIPLAVGVESLSVCDRWSSISESAPLYSSLFTESIFRRREPTSVVLESGMMMVEVSVPMVKADEVVVMVGSSALLGEWDVERGVVLADGDFPTWRTPSLPTSEEMLGAEFKFVLFNRVSGNVVWEQGENRSLARCRALEGTIYVVEREPHFALPAWRGAGVAIPLFSLRSEESMGVGEFADLKKMVDWARMTGQKIIQILPINDTTMGCTWEDSYPYNANSIFALHPQYISLKAVGELRDKEQQREIEEEGRRLNALSKIDYEAVNRLKNRYLKQIYSECGDATLAKAEFVTFFENNRYWLESYALYSLLRDKYRSSDSALWGEEAIYSEEMLGRYKADHGADLGYYYFVQYHLHCQLLEARAYALSNEVAFKGDIPIGVSRTSVDVWVNPRLFRLDAQAGAPPDDFSVLGQNWGFPTYNWEEMALDGYAWWQARFSKMAEYFDAYRIDHILGFFRIWEIPLTAVHGLLGHFNPAMPFTPEQMQSSYGFSFDESSATPEINGWLLNHLFGERAEEVVEHFLVEGKGGRYRFKAEFDSQLKVAKAVEDETLRDGLMMLFTEVLFVEDPYKVGCYHPRISAQKTLKYRAMSSEDKQRYDDLYNDFYYYRHNDYWGQEAMKKLPMLVSATNMLTCGEDLGMIPDCVPHVMDHEQILSLEIQRMPKDPNLMFGEPWNYPYRSVCTTSTHDMNPIRAWLREDRELSEHYFRDVLGVTHSMGEDCVGWLCELIVRQHLNSPAMWVILPLQDWMAIDESVRAVDPESERINVPANSRHYWRYRMHCTIEELIAQKAFNLRVAELVRGR